MNGFRIHEFSFPSTGSGQTTSGKDFGLVNSVVSVAVVIELVEAAEASESTTVKSHCFNLIILFFDLVPFDRLRARNRPRWNRWMRKLSLSKPTVS